MKTLSQLIKKTFYLSSAIFFLVQCGGDDSKKVSTPSSGCSGSFKDACTVLLVQETCNNCHVPGQTIFDSQGAKLDFTSATTLFTSLTTLSSAYNGNEDCIGIPYINTTTVTNSFLLGMIDSSLAKDDFAGKTGCTISSAHAANNFIGTAADITTIKTWITAGAAK